MRAALILDNLAVFGWSIYEVVRDRRAKVRRFEAELDADRAMRGTGPYSLPDVSVGTLLAMPEEARSRWLEEAVERWLDDPEAHPEACRRLMRSLRATEPAPKQERLPVDQEADTAFDAIAEDCSELDMLMDRIAGERWAS